MAYVLVYTGATGARWEQSTHRTFAGAVDELRVRLIDPLTRRALPFYVNHAAQELRATGRNGRGEWTVEWRARSAR